MKIFIITLFAVLTLSASDIAEFAERMSYETEYKSALEIAKKGDKKLMMVMVTNYCPWCRKFEKRTLIKDEVNTLVHKDYVPLILNREKG